jgi:GMP synthase (glutamine-hydrolysing)
MSGSPRLACLHHLAQPFLGQAERPLRAAGLELDERRLAEGDPLPALGEADGILTLGGSESVVDIAGDATLTAEAALLREATAAGVPVLGVCLGGQLLAHALGGTVRRQPRRTVAWLELEALPAAADDPLFAPLGPRVPTLHWNEDVFTLPPGGTELLAGAPAGVAAFRAGGSAWGVQFHPDVDRAALDGWYERYAAWLDGAGVAEAAARAADDRHFAAHAEASERLFASFARVVSERGSSAAAG